MFSSLEAAGQKDLIRKVAEMPKGLNIQLSRLLGVKENSLVGKERDAETLDGDTCLAEIENIGS